MVDIVHRVGIKAPVAQVYAALAHIDGLAAWWTEDTRGNAAVGGQIDFRFRNTAGDDVGGFVMEVLDQQPDAALRWRVQDGPAEWLGTEIEFQLSQQDDFAVLMFGHRGWREPGEFMAHCSTKWATFLLSLRDLVETGCGSPAPRDLKISNWH
jgi:uncharacterized protein YndB with AHSA1/START domain